MRSGRFSWALHPILAGACAYAMAADGAARDPTQMPPVLQQDLSPAAADGLVADTPEQPFFIMSLGGRLTVIHNAHRLYLGDALDNSRIVRIDNDAVWLRENGQVKKVAIYPDVIKRPADPPASPPQRHRRASATKKDAP